MLSHMTLHAVTPLCLFKANPLLWSNLQPAIGKSIKVGYGNAYDAGNANVRSTLVVYRKRP